MSDTPRNRRRVAKVLSSAFPALTEKEVRQLLRTAQDVKRGERDYSIVQRHPGDGQGLSVDATVRP